MPFGSLGAVGAAFETRGNNGGVVVAVGLTVVSSRGCSGVAGAFAGDGFTNKFPSHTPRGAVEDLAGSARTPAEDPSVCLFSATRTRALLGVGSPGVGSTILLRVTGGGPDGFRGVVAGVL